MRITDEMVVIRTPSTRGADEYGQLVVTVEGDSVNENNVDRIVSIAATNPVTEKALSLTEAERRIAGRLLLTKSLGLRAASRLAA